MIADIINIGFRLGVPVLLLHISFSTSLVWDRQANIILIMSDDQDKNAISAYAGHLIEIPNIDPLAREGMRFDRGFVTNSICAPSRAVILNGKYSHLNGLRDNRDLFNMDFIVVNS